MKNTLILPTLLLGCSTLCFAESTKNDNKILALESLVVSSNFQAVEMDSVASSITVITKEQIENQKATFLTDVLRYVPGFAVSQTGGVGTQTQIRVRGAESNHLLVLIDGVRVNDPSVGDDFQYQYALSDQIERIEIIRGPQSVVWGSDALAGIINIITNQNDQQLKQFNIHAETGSFDSNKAGFNASLSNNNISFNGGVQFYESAGTNISRVGNEKDGVENLSVLANININASQNSDIHLGFRHVTAENEFDGVDFFVTGLPVDGDQYTEADTSTFQAHWNYNNPHNNWQTQLAVNYLDTDNENYSGGLANGSTASDSLECSLKHSFNFSHSRRLTLLANQREVDFSQKGLASPFGNPNQDQSYTSRSLAVEYFQQYNENLSWSISGRSEDFNRFDDVNIFQAGFSYAINDQWRLRGSIATGSKAPTFTERFGFFADQFIGNPDLKPEQSDSFELAIKKTWLQGQFTTEIVYFDQDLEDEIDGFVFDLDSSLFTATNKLNDSKRSGYEFLFGSQISDQVRFDFNYSYTKAEEFNSAGQQVKEVRRPENLANAHLDFSFADSRGHLNIGVNYSDEQFDNFFDPITFIAERVILPSFTVVNLAASWEATKKIELYVKANNLLDREYEEVLGFRRPGLGVFAGIRAQF
jgi:vitamin B12 transporter